MYISNLIQPDGRTRNISSNHRLSPCAKTIGALLLILSNTAAWANVDAVKKTHVQEIEHAEDLRLLQQMREMKEHSQYLQNDLERVEQELYQKRPKLLDVQHPLPPTQEVKNLEERRMYLQRQIDQQNAQFGQLQKSIESRQPPRTEEDIHKPQIPPIKPIQFEAQSKKDHSDVTNIAMNVTGLTEVVAAATEFMEYAKKEQADSVEYPAYYKQWQQMREMEQHFKYLKNDLAEVRQKLQQKMEEGMHWHPEIKNLEEREKYLLRQLDQHNEQMQQKQKLIQQQRFQKLQDEHVQNPQSESQEQKNLADKSNTSKETVAGPVAETVTGAATETATGAATETATGAATETATGAVAETTTEAVAETATGAVAETATGAVAETATGATTETATGAVAETTTEAVAETTTEAVAETATGATTETATGAVAETATGAATETATGAATETATGAVAETATGAVAETATGATTETATGATTETATGAVAETATEAVAKPDAKAKTAKKALSSPPKTPPAQVPKAVPKPAPVISHNPQVGSYIANQIAAQQMFITDDLQYRQGETRYIDPVTGEEKVSSLWINTSGAKNRFNSGNDQLRTKSNRYAIQLGGTINKWSSGGDDQGILGITAGFGKSTNHSHSTSSHHQAQGSVDGYNLGLYSIWYADNQTRLGPYIDLLTQYGWFNNQVKAPNVTTAANYKSYLFTSALETGYKIQLLETADTKLSIQPRAKVMWQRTSGLLHQEPNAILINVEEDNAVTTKLGMRTVLEFNIDTLSSAKNLQISPSFEANWIHSRVNQGVQLSRVNVTPQRVQDKIELASVNVSPQGNNNIADLKLGIEANIDSNLRLWTHLGHQFGGHNYNDTQVTLGANYRF